jgi:hypothetical protein
MYFVAAPSTAPPARNEAPPKLGPRWDGFFAVFHESGPDALSRFRSVIGGKSPIALCGFTSL